MTESELVFINKLKQQISIADELIMRSTLLHFEAMSDSSNNLFDNFKGVCERFEGEVNDWFNNTLIILHAYNGETYSVSQGFADIFRRKVNYKDFKREIVQKINSGRCILNCFIEAEQMREGAQSSAESMVKKANKPPKVFISHKKEDQAYANAIVSLINFIIGSDGDKVFCSSIPGYGIKTSQDIIDKIKDQFDYHDLFVVIIHSPRYYKSAVCLNEMGAAWALNAKFCSFLTKDCRFDQLTGVIGKEELCINLNSEEEMLNDHLNSFKDDLVAFFGVCPIDQSKWEHERNEFIKAIAGIKDAVVPGEKTNLFDTLYLTSFDTIFEYIDADHFHDWAYQCAIDGNAILHKSILDSLDRAILFIKSRPKHKEYSSWDSLIQNLGLLLSDFLRVFACHSDNFGYDAYTVERFYKYGPMGQTFNPNYDVDLKAFEEHIFLLSDLMFELARLGNLILTRIREIHPEYKWELGILYIDDRVTTPDLVYREEEISDSPYPGLDKFISVRLTREKHYGTSSTINIDGYEKDYNPFG